jgi:peptide/nickel transport system ATP-binding protein
VPALRELRPGHQVSCHWAEEVAAGQITPTHAGSVPAAEA